MEFKDRLKIAIDNKGVTPYAIGRDTEISKVSIRNYLNGTKPSIDNLNILSDYLGVSAEWLLTGKDSLPDNNIKVDKEIKNKITAIKYYPSVSGSMGGVEFLDSPNENSVDMIVPGFSECRFAINAYGDSMYPVIKSGQIVLLMEWKERFIEWGRIYLVVTKSGYRTIKYLKPSKENDSISCESENKENNPPFDIKKEDILKLFLVKGWVCREAI